MERRGWGAEVYVYIEHIDILFHAKKNVLSERLCFGDVYKLRSTPLASPTAPVPNVSLYLCRLRWGAVQDFMNPMFFPKDKPTG